MSQPRHTTYSIAALYNYDHIAYGCEKLVQGFFTAATWPGVEPRIYDKLVG